MIYKVFLDCNNTARIYTVEAENRKEAAAKAIKTEMEVNKTGRWSIQNKGVYSDSKFSEMTDREYDDFARTLFMS